MKRVLIIGAGPAGLTTAYQLLKQKSQEKYEVIVIEKDKEIGGISKTVKLDENHLVDTGIHRFFSKNDEINKIWEEILPIQSKPAYDDIQLKKDRVFPENGSDPEKEDKSLLIKDRYTRIYYKKHFFDYPISIKFQNIKNLGMLTIIKAGFSYLKALIIKKEENSLENFYINRFGKVLYSIFFENYTEKVWGVHPSKISADWGAQRVKGISITEILKDLIRKIFKVKKEDNTQVSLIDRFFYPKLGAGQMWEEMAKEIEKLGGKIIKEAEITGIEIDDNQIKSVEYKTKGETITEYIDILVSSMPIKDLIIAIKNEKVPKDIFEIATNLPYREFMTVCMLTKKIKLENKTNIKTIGNIVPDDWIYIQEPDVKMGRLQIFNNWSPYLFEDKQELETNVLIGLEYFCSEGDKYWNMCDEEFIEFAEKEAIKIGIIDEGDLITAKRIKIPKAYPAYFGTYKNINKVIRFLNAFENLYCVGRNGQHRYNNMDHSMLTGIETAKNIIENVKNKGNIWNVNTEKEYHEIKKKGNNK